MSTRRVVIGRQNDGTYGLRAALPGEDALTADEDDSDALSFNSDWTNALSVHMVGTATIGTTWPDSSHGFVFFPALAYIPYAEVRAVSGNTVFDDLLSSIKWFTASTPANPVNCTVTWFHALMSTNHIRFSSCRSTIGVMYAVYKKST